MNHLGLLALSAAAVLTVAGTDPAPSPTKAPKVVAVDGGDLFRARRVVRRFFDREARPECYRILFSQSDVYLRVDFIPKSDEPLVLESGQQPQNVEEPCGRNVGYLIDREGRVIRRVYSR